MSLAQARRVSRVYFDFGDGSAGVFQFPSPIRFGCHSTYTMSKRLFLLLFFKHSLSLLWLYVQYIRSWYDAGSGGGEEEEGEGLSI